MATIRFLLIGGFLGAGKTTTIARLASYYQQQGKRVGIVTNDQAEDLVDTQSLRSQGFQVGEVAGACFCCNFNEMTEVVAKLSEEQRPDIVLAEPVGSCTDLVATVIQPLRQLYNADFEVAPYGVLVKPSHGKRILAGTKRAGFSPKAEYIFHKQLEEADFLVINRIDELPGDEVEEIYSLLQKSYPETPIVKMSAKSGEGFDAYTEFLAQTGSFGQRILDIDYDTYAEGEAELGWLNASVKLQSPKPFALDDLLTEVVDTLKKSLATLSAEPAHLKTIGLTDSTYGVANLVSSDLPAELSLPAHTELTEVNLVVNARVAIDPETLEQQVRSAVEQACQARAATAEYQQMHALRPGRPVPTHRLADPV